MSIQLRIATSADSEYLLEMSYQLLEDEGLEEDISMIERQAVLQEWIEDGWSILLILKDHQIAGYMIYRKQREEFPSHEQTVFVREFFVRREYRRRGVGRSAFELIVNEYIPRDVTITLNVPAANHTALRFWQEKGFEVFSTTLRLVRA